VSESQDLEADRRLLRRAVTAAGARSASITSSARMKARCA